MVIVQNPKLNLGLQGGRRGLLKPLSNCVIGPNWGVLGFSLLWEGSCCAPCFRSQSRASYCRIRDGKGKDRVPSNTIWRCQNRCPWVDLCILEALPLALTTAGLPTGASCCVLEVYCTLDKEHDLPL